jgi:hypothetical protein
MEKCHLSLLPLCCCCFGRVEIEFPPKICTRALEFGIVGDLAKNETSDVREFPVGRIFPFFRVIKFEVVATILIRLRCFFRDFTEFGKLIRLNGSNVVRERKHSQMSLK